MSTLEEQLKARIAAEGPIGVDEFMAAANAHYYATRDPLGAKGDFVTAPEIHQMFGELVGAALADAWVRADRPGDAVYAELGPGRGTLANDALRVLRRAGFGGEVHLVETSQALRAAQARLLPEAKFHDAMEELPDAPLLLVANEFFDALPVTQWVGDEERRVAHDGSSFAFTVEGSIRETSPAREAAVESLAGHLSAHGGVGIVIDYGYSGGEQGDTLQAVRGHQFADPLEAPGEQDLTAHVDFAALADAARRGGARASRVASQGTWLETLGIGARAMALAAKNPQDTESIAAARRRLCDEEEMGRLFKVMALIAPGWPDVAGVEIVSVTYRTATVNDAEELAGLGTATFVATFGHLYQPDDLAIFLQNHSSENWAKELGDPAFAVRVAEQDGKMVGYAKLGPPHLPFEPRGEAAELRQLYVVEEMKGQGIAHALIEWVIDRARERPADHLYLSVFTDNHRARRFYEKFGFEPEGTHAFMVGSHADEDIVMRLQL